MKKITYTCTFTDDVLGMSPNSEDIYKDYIASKAPDANNVTDEIEAIGKEAVEEKGITVFPEDASGSPFLWDYQIKGFFKDAIGMLSKLGKAGYEGGKACAGIKAYKKAVDGMLFV